MWPFRKKTKKTSEDTAEFVKQKIKETAEPEFKKTLKKLNDSLKDKRVRVGLEVSWIIEEYE